MTEHATTGTGHAIAGTGIVVADIARERRLSAAAGGADAT